MANAQNLESLTAYINQSIGGNLNQFIAGLTVTMQDGAATIISGNTGQSYYLSQSEVDSFNAAYGVALTESTAEFLINALLDNQVDLLQQEFIVQKEILLNQAQEIAAVTAIARELNTASSSDKVAINNYAVENSLTGISLGAVDAFNNSIDGMVSASRTKNMIEQYRGAIVESTSFLSQATQTTESFFNEVEIRADEYSNSVNVEWEGQSVSVEGNFWNDSAAFEERYFENNNPMVSEDES